jgi:small-conductance mechanosensitive channel
MGDAMDDRTPRTPRTHTLRTAATASLAVLLAPAAAWAQEADVAAITQIARVVRWGGVLTSLGLILAVWILLKFLDAFIEGLSSRFADRRMTFHKIATFLQFFIYIGTGIATLMLSFRLDDRVLAVVGGTVAVSVGFAVKDLVASFVAGITIMLDRPFQVGDRVSFGGQYGDIRAIGLRSVRLQTLDDNTVTIPNNKFLSDITSCGNYGALDMQVVMDFLIGVDQDVERARRIAYEAALSSLYVFLPKPIVVNVNSVIENGYVAVRLRLKAYVLDTKYENAFVTDVNLRVLAAFREAGILPPAVLHRPLAGANPEGVPA